MQPQVLTNAVIITSRASKLDFPSRDDTRPPGCILCSSQRPSTTFRRGVALRGLHTTQLQALTYMVSKQIAKTKAGLSMLAARHRAPQPPGCILCRDSPMALHTLLHLWVRKNCSMPRMPRLVLVKRDRSLGQWMAGSMSTNAFWAGL